MPDNDLLIRIHEDSGVWRATLGDYPAKGYTSAAVDPWDAVLLTLAKAREAGWALIATAQPEPTSETTNKEI